MCGIAAIVQIKSNSHLQKAINSMVDAISHRGPDGEGVSISGQVALGHTRLSIIDLSDRAAQPMQLESDRLVFNGEIYNYLELRAELEAKGHVFTTTSDTEVLLRSIQTWGMLGLHKLKGMFAFVFHSARENAVYFVRDRFGIKPLAYCVTPDFIYAASEAKQILATGNIRSRIDMVTANTFLAHGRLSHNHSTFFEGISQLEPGTMARVNLNTGSLQVSRWYDLSSNIKPLDLSYESARLHTSDLLKNSIKLHLRADVRLGAMLSGGLDSSVITTLTKVLAPEVPLHTITSYREVEGIDERAFSNIIAARCDAIQIEVRPDTESIWTLERLMELGRIQDQPICGGSHYNEYCVYRTARENGLTVMLSGQGADEYFGGYGEFWFVAQLDALRKGYLVRFWDGIRARAAATQRSQKVVARNFVRLLLSKSYPQSQSLGPHAGMWVRGALPKFAKVQREFTALAIEEMTLTSLPYQLHSEDRNSMNWSVESRLPFLDHELVEFVMGLPIEYCVGAGQMKRILRDATPELPREISQRRDKIGFASADSQTLWPQADAVSALMEDALAFFGEALDANFVRSSLADMVDKKTWYDPVFFRILSLYGWARSFSASI